MGIILELGSASDVLEGSGAFVGGGVLDEGGSVLDGGGGALDEGSGSLVGGGGATSVTVGRVSCCATVIVAVVSTSATVVTDVVPRLRVSEETVDPTSGSQAPAPIVRPSCATTVGSPLR